MSRFAFALLAIVSIGASASSSLFPKSLSLRFGSVGTQFPQATLHSARQLIATELGLGQVKFYNEQSFNSAVEICIEGKWETLSQLHHAIEKLPIPAKSRTPEISLHEQRCHQANQQGPENQIR